MSFRKNTPAWKKQAGRLAPPKPPCRHPEHNPPNMTAVEPGIYEHQCPSCKVKNIITISDGNNAGESLATTWASGTLRRVSL